MAAKKKITVKDILTEDQLQQWLTLTSKQVEDLRRKHGLPYIGINRNTRIYSVPDLLKWFELKRQNVSEIDSMGVE